MHIPSLAHGTKLCMNYSRYINPIGFQRSRCHRRYTVSSCFFYTYTNAFPFLTSSFLADSSRDEVETRVEGWRLTRVGPRRSSDLGKRGTNSRGVLGWWRKVRRGRGEGRQGWGITAERRGRRTLWRRRNEERGRGEWSRGTRRRWWPTPSWGCRGNAGGVGALGTGRKGFPRSFDQGCYEGRGDDERLDSDAEVLRHWGVAIPPSGGRVRCGNERVSASAPTTDEWRPTIDDRRPTTDDRHPSTTGGCKEKGGEALALSLRAPFVPVFIPKQIVLPRTGYGILC